MLKRVCLVCWIIMFTLDKKNMIPWLDHSPKIRNKLKTWVSKKYQQQESWEEGKENCGWTGCHKSLHAVLWKENCLKIKPELTCGSLTSQLADPWWITHCLWIQLNGKMETFISLWHSIGMKRSNRYDDGLCRCRLVQLWSRYVHITLDPLYIRKQKDSNQQFWSLTAYHNFFYRASKKYIHFGSSFTFQI